MTASALRAIEVGDPPQAHAPHAWARGGYAVFPAGSRGAREVIASLT